MMDLWEQCPSRWEFMVYQYMKRQLHEMTIAQMESLAYSYLKKMV